MELQTFLNTVPSLTDLELAVLLCLIARQHCLLTVDDALVDDMASELSLVVSEIFGLSYAVLEPEDLASVDRFGDAILEMKSREYSFGDDNGEPETLRSQLADVDMRAAPSSVQDQPDLDSRMVVNVIIAKGFNLANKSVQIQALELLRRRRFFGRTSVHPVQKMFLFLPVVSSSSRAVRLDPHLNDRIFISHYHSPQDPFANIEELEMSGSSDKGSSRGSLHRFDPQASRKGDRTINHSTVDQLRRLGESVTITAEVRRYLQDIITFLRLERGVEGGVTSNATTLFVLLSKYLAALHGLDFVTPSLVLLAARKIYSHRILISSPERERSMQYGSDLSAVTGILAGLTPEDLIETVLNTVPCPI